MSGWRCAQGRVVRTQRTPNPPTGAAWAVLTSLAFLAGLSLPSFSLASPAEVRWASAFSTAMEQAQAEQKYVMVDFFTSWCHWCKVLDERTYNDPRVTAFTNRMVSVKVNAEAEKQIAAKYAVGSYPTILFLNPDGSVRRRVVGFQPPEVFAPALDEVLKGDTEIFALASQVRASPGNASLRQELAGLLARAGRLPEAAAQLDTLLDLDGAGEEMRVAAELDHWIWLLRAGTDRDGGDVRKGLERWVKKKGKRHPRRVDGLFYLAMAEELDGKAKDARKHLAEVIRVRPASWFAEEARARLATPGS